MGNILKSSGIVYNTLRYNYLMRKQSITKPSDPGLLLDVLNKYNEHNTVFVHIGLRPIKSAYQTEPYSFIFEALTKRFNNIIAPGFTPSFRKTGLYHKKYSIPEFGKFSGLFLNDATYRTDDPIYSLLVYGDYKFDNLYAKETFGHGSCFDQLAKENILCINIGTKWAVSSQIHYSEYKNNLPYISAVEYDGILYRNETQYEKIKTVNYTNNHWFNKYVTVMWNRHKILNHMHKKGVLDYYNLNGVKVFAFKLGDLGRLLDEKLSKNPYYLLT